MKNLVNAQHTKTEEKKYKVVTLGCRTNQYESQAYMDQLKQMGYREAQTRENAHICIVNTCTVTESADKRSLYQIRKLSRENPDAHIVVTGCLAERAKQEIETIPGVSHVVPNQKKEQLLQAVYPNEDLPEFEIKRFEAHTRAFVKVQDGCNSFCSYCIIPYVRGRSRSKSIPAILQEIEGLIKNGYQEVVLTGINIGDFDGGVAKGETPYRLAQLIKEVDQIPGLERIRVSSIDPDEVDDELLETIIFGKKTCHSMHIVLQAGSNAVLKRMNRKYTKQDFYQAATKLRKAAPDFSFTTDIIVGFPGETEGDFQETLEMVEHVEFAKVHMFPFSLRPGTRAARFPEFLPEAVIQERKYRLMQHAEKVAMRYRKRFIGKKMRVLLESEDPNRPGYILGHTDNFLMCSLPKKHLHSNQIVEVTCLENHADGLVGALNEKEVACR